MLKAEHLKSMPANHVFAKGEIDIPELSEKTLRWIAIWNQKDWRILVAPSEHNFREVELKGKVVDVEKYIQKIQPCSSDAMALYIK